MSDQNKHMQILNFISKRYLADQYFRMEWDWPDVGRSWIKANIAKVQVFLTTNVIEARSHTLIHLSKLGR